jgi:hypothetical protein
MYRLLFFVLLLCVDLESESGDVKSPLKGGGEPAGGRNWLGRKDSNLHRPH